MGRKKRDLLFTKPFCYYCDKIFNNEIVLHQHQKSKHFTCATCRKNFSTVSSMCSHISSVHKATLEKIPNAMTGRDSVELNIFGMTGVPRHITEERVMSGVANHLANLRNALLKSDYPKIHERVEALEDEN